MAFAGDRDLAHAVTALEARLPAPLGVLARLALNYRWTWLPDGAELFRELDPWRWELCGENPFRLLQETSTQTLARAAADRCFLDRAVAAAEIVDADLARPFAEGVLTCERPAAFLCAEFGVHASLPIYAGGLGALAGDLLKAASDRAAPLVAVGLLYRRGYFRQRIDASGWQHEYWTEVDPERLPMALVTDRYGQPVTIRVPLRGREVVAQIWRVDVGRVPLYLLDAERSENSRFDRWITSQLYHGSRTLRLAQYLLLGAGAIRALRVLGIEPAVVHLNEGHAALAPHELAREQLAGGRSFDEALAAARERTVFTTHTPVRAGNETYAADEIEEVLAGFRDELGLSPEAFLSFARTHPDQADEPAGLTQAGLRLSRACNGVSRRHGEVARRMWQPLFPGRDVDAVPISHVTNGVHVPSWMAPALRALLDRYLGPGWEGRASDPATWAGIDAIPDGELWAVRNRLRAQLVEYVRNHSAEDRLSRNEPHDYVEAAARAFDPDVLTVGFARRLASYKRLHLVAWDVRRAIQLIDGPRPIQLVIAGKAHPNDEQGKQIVQQLFRFKGVGRIGARVAFLHDYDLGIALQLVRGCDLWVNAPRPPLEASGTSGMKSAFNGGLQLSVLDGWWAEAFDGHNGWAIPGEVDDDHEAQDARHADALYRILEKEVVPSFYERDAAGVPRAWIARIKTSLRTLGPVFGADRMFGEYLERVYTPAAGGPR